MTKALSGAEPGSVALGVSTVECCSRLACCMYCSPMPNDPTKVAAPGKHATRLTPGPMSPVANYRLCGNPAVPYHASGPVALRPCLATGLPSTYDFSVTPFGDTSRSKCPHFY